MYGDRLKGTLDLPADYSIASRVGSVLGEMWGSTSAPTNTQKEGFRIAKKAFTPILERFNKFVSGDLKSMEDRLNQLGAPYTPGRKIEE
jgi:hypothetical protein